MRGFGFMDIRVVTTTLVLASSLLLLGAAVTTPPTNSDFAAVKAKAESGDVAAQIELADRYDTGKGVEKSYVESFKWWLKAAEQGNATAQHNVGVAYVAGLGVAKNKDEAIKWFTKAAERGNVKAAQYAERLKQGNSASTQVVAPAGTPKVGTTLTTRYGEKEAICAEVVKEFVATHKYVPGSFVCVEFAAGVWYELMQKGVLAKVRVGSKSVDLATIGRADHAWVMAQMDNGMWLAIEPQGAILYPDDLKNKSYYRGFDFLDDSDVREHNRILRRLRDEQKAYLEAKAKLDETINEGFGGQFIQMQQQLLLDQLEKIRKVEGDLMANYARAIPSD